MFNFLLKKKEITLCKTKINKLTKQLNIDNDKDDANKYHIIIHALMKEVPTEVQEYEDNDGKDETGRYIIRHFYGCPNCHKIIYYHCNYCNNCGQKLHF